MSETIAATFLFTDLVGSTELSSGMSSSEAEALRQLHFGLLRGAIEAAGGREVKNLGDGLMVVFFSPSRAVACAVGMQRAIDRHNRRSPVHLGVRIGLSTGEAIEEDEDSSETRSSRPPGSVPELPAARSWRRHCCK